jgi:hypothetical protein
MTRQPWRAIRWLGTETAEREIQLLAENLPLGPNQILGLRKRFSDSEAAALTGAAVQLAAAQAKLSIAGAMASDRGLQQSTDWQIARYKASRLPVAVPVFDVCCGVGGDSQALATRGPLVAIDRDPAVCLMAAHNLAKSGAVNAAIVCQSADVVLGRPGTWVHIDPDRRPSGKRVSDPNHCEPSAATIAKWISACDGGAIKMSPAASLPSSWPGIVEREWISRGGACRQQVGWFGINGHPGHRRVIRATVVGNDGTANSFAIEQNSAEQQSSPQTPPVSSPQRWLFDFDPAVRASGLSEAFGKWLGVRAIESPAGFFTTDHLRQHRNAGDRQRATSLAACFEVIWTGSRDLKKLRRAVEQFQPSALEIKVRGTDLTPEQLRPRLMKKSWTQLPLTLLIGATFAALARRA